MDIDGTNQRRLTSSPAFDSSPTLNARTGRVVFESSGRESKVAIYSIGTDRQNEKPLLGRDFVDFSPAFSRDGSKFVLASTRGGGSFYIVSSEGTVLTSFNVDNGYAVGQPSFHPNGRTIAFVDSPADAGGGTINVINIDGTGRKEITPGQSIDNSPHFSPDGSKIVFSRNLFDSGQENSEIYIMNADGTNPVRLTNNAAYDGSPSFNADGSKIVFSSRRDGNGEIYIMNADGTNPTRLTTNAAEDDLPSTS